ncbi:MAG TPA: T9SS type A sorting domain-containing protein, partial [Bacteroidia bacterium]|nr:T9SS type A sorting domain-containing protein [Bacteroidia bacterium]
VAGFPAVSFSSAAANDFYYLRASDANGLAWGTKIPVGDTNQVVTSENKLTVMNGKPKIVFRYLNPKEFYFQGALDVTGNSWDIPVRIQNRGVSGLFCSLKIVKGCPALSFYESVHSNLCYVRAADTSGLIPWQPPVIVDGNAGSGFGSKLELVNGRPAIAYINYSSNIFRLKFVRAADATGSAWGASVLLDSIANLNLLYSSISLAVINDTPSVSYYNPANSHLMFVRAGNPNGTSWASPVAVDTIGMVGKYNSLAEVNGHPAIAYYDSTNQKLKYARAINSSGSSWGTPLEINSSGNVGQYASMCVVNGFPAIASNGGLYFHANDSDGTTWNNPVTIGTGNSESQLTIAAGKPAVAYMSGNYLKYSRSTDHAGVAWGTADSVFSGLGTYISHAGTIVKSYITYYNTSEATALYFSKTLVCTPPAAAITASGPTSFCSGDSVELNALMAANRSYQWKKNSVIIPGATNSDYTATVGGTYKVTVTNTLTGCVRTSAVGAVVTIYALPAASITPQGPTTFCAGDSVTLKANSGAGLIYQWKKNGTNISGAVNINYVADSAGLYKVKVTNANGCKRTSAGVQVTVPCRLMEDEKEDESLFDVNVFPNPSPGDFIFTIQNENDEKTSIKIFDAIGKNIFYEESFTPQLLIRNGQLPPGVFSALITNGANSKILKLVKIK